MDASRRSGVDGFFALVAVSSDPSTYATPLRRAGDIVMRPSVRSPRPAARRLALVVAALLSTATLAACDNTIRGIGQDIKDTGRAIGDAAS